MVSSALAEKLPSLMERLYAKGVSLVPEARISFLRRP
jgi:hypothetical protein